MAAVNLSTPVVGASIVYPGWSKKQVTPNKVQQLMASKFTEIVADYDQRRQNKDLSRGPWYANHYATALKEANQTRRLEFFIKKNAFFHGFPPKGFNHLDNPQSPTQKEPTGYQIKPDCLPTVALDSVRNGQVSVIDCGIAVELAMYETLREVLGDTQFNSIFSGTGPTPLYLHSNLGETPLCSRDFLQTTSGQTPRLGDMVYFSNIPSYVNRHPNGESKGYNAICISADNIQEKKYIAFGTSAEGKTESEMYDLLVQEFNEKPTPASSIYETEFAKLQTMLSRNKEIEFFQATGIKIADFQISRADFDSAVRDSAHQLAGLNSFKTHLDITTIKKFLK